MFERDLAFVGQPVDRRGARRLRRARERNVPFAGEQSRRRIEADPAGARQVHLAPCVQVGEVDRRAARTVERLHVRHELDQIAGHEARGDAEMPAQLHEQPAAVAARPRAELERLRGRLHARLHPYQVADVALQPLIQRDQEIHGAGRRAIDAVEIRAKRGRRARLRVACEIRREFDLQRIVVAERILLRAAFEEEVERVVHRHLGDQIDRDVEMVGAFGKHEPRKMVRERVLLPVDEVPCGLDRHRIRDDRRPAVRCGTQPHDLRAEIDEPVVAIAGGVVQRDVDGHGSSDRGWVGPASRRLDAARAARRWRRAGASDKFRRLRDADVDAHGDRADAGHRLRIAAVEPDRDAHVALVRATVHERIEADPA